MIARNAIVLSILLAVALVPAAPAAASDDIVRDFAPLTGYVVMAADGEFLIDRDAGDGIGVGDLFSVVLPGKKIVHPVTGEALGTLDRVKGYLQVTRIRSGYSHARPLEVKEAVVPGDVIRRFDHVPAAFLDTTGRGRPIFDRIRAALPGLEWRYETSADAGKKPSLPEGALLAFILEPGKLVVRGPEGALRSYDMPGGERDVPPPAPPASRKESAKEPLPPAGEGISAGKAASADFVVRGILPEGTLMADFTRDGDRLLLAVTEGTRIEVFAVGDNLVPVAAGDTKRAGQFLSLHWWKPQPDGPPLLAATLAVDENRAFSASLGQTLVGSLFILRQGRLDPVREDIPFILGSFDRDGDGVRETLLGQTFDRDIFFGDRVRELRWNGKDVAIGDPSFPVSLPFAVQGALIADLTGDGRPETAFVRNRTLFIYAGKELLYESSQQMGGSLSVLTYDVNPGAANRLVATAAFEVPPVAVDLDGDGRMEVVAIASEGSLVTGIGSGVRKSWLASLAFRGGQFVRGTLGPELETPLQGLYANRNGVFVVTTHASGLFKPKRASQLLFLPLNDPTRR